MTAKHYHHSKQEMMRSPGPFRFLFGVSYVVLSLITLSATNHLVSAVNSDEELDTRSVGSKVIEQGSTRSGLRKTRNLSLLKEEKEGSHTDTMMVNENDMPPPSDPNVDTLSNLEKCFMDYAPPTTATIYSDKNGKLVSNIPVKEAAFTRGLFVEDVDKEHCYSNDDGDLDPSCMKVGSAHCRMCVFDSSLLPVSPDDSSKETTSFSDLLPCRDEIKDIAEKCREMDCIDVRPTIEEYENQESNNSRKLISYDNVLGSNKARWMTTLGDKLGSDRSGVTLKDFVLPGSHNTAAVRMASAVCATGFSLPILNQSQRNQVAKCQEDTSIYKQLENGIRYLDLRIVDAASFEGKRYPLHHSYLIDSSVDTMEKALEQINLFVRRNPGEFVVVRIKARGSCYGYNSVKYGGWKDEYNRIAGRLSRLHRYNNDVLNYNLWSLRGKVFVDIDEQHAELYFGNSGVHGPEYGQGDGNPFEVARKIRDDGKFRQNENKFNAWSFFPAPSGSQKTNLLLSNLADPFSRDHDGLEDWDANFQKHVWLMHTLIAHKGQHVNAILRDRATTRKNIYHVATQLTLYRVFDKMKNTGKSWMDKVMTHEWVNEWDEKFEHRCPVGWLLGGMQSTHDNRREDRLWKFSCYRVDWLSGGSWWYDYDPRNSRWRNDLHDAIWYKNTEVDVSTHWDREFTYGWKDCSSAITGIGGIHNNKREDRRFWFYASPVVKGSLHSSSCSWTGTINSWDGWMDRSVGNNQYIGQIWSKHDNKREDRQWKFCVCTKY